jgi:hypothetical protein
MRSAGSNGSGDGARWRVFISHTSELRNFPRGQQSYVAEVERAISAAGHVVVDMADFPAADQLAARVCIDTVRGCDVYVGVLGTRYGSPVRDKPEVSYTELEFDTATQAEMDRLVFLLDTNAESVGIPLSQLIDREYGDRQDAFRRKVPPSPLRIRPSSGSWWNARSGNGPRQSGASTAGSSASRSRPSRSRCGRRSSSTRHRRRRRPGSRTGRSRRACWPDT